MAADAAILLPLAGLVAALAVAGFVFQRLRLPPAVGYLLVGLAGSQLVRGIGLDTAAVEQAAQVGILFLLFAIGLELDIQRLRDALRRTAMVLPVDILVPALLIAGAVRVLTDWSFLQAITLGLCLSISSTLFGERLSSAAGFPAEGRRRVLGMLLSEDVVAGALLALLVVLGTDGGDALAPLWTVSKVLLFLLLAAAAALLIVPRVLDRVARTHSHELLVLTGAAVVVGFGAIGNIAGAAPLGALVAGVAAAEAGSRFVVRNALQTVREVALAAFFFASGLPVQVESILAHPLLVVAVAGVFFAAKLVVHVPTSLASGLGLAASLRTSIALGTVGEFSLIMVATAQAVGPRLFNPLLRDVVVGAMVLLLIAAPLVMLAVPRLVALTRHLPDRLRRPLQWFVHSSRQTRTRTSDAPRLRSGVRLLAVNLVLLIAWTLFCAAVAPLAAARVPAAWQGFPASVALVGVGLAVAVPLVVGVYRAYRNLVGVVVGMSGVTDRAGQVRVRLVDAWVAISAAMLLIPLGLLAPDILPVLLGGIFLAVIIVTVAWRRLRAFHQTMEASLARVLGHDPEAGAILDRMLERYPWGIRFTAVPVPPGSPVAGMRLSDVRLQERTGATLAVIQRRGREIVSPGPSEAIQAGDTLILLGDVHQIARGEALVVAHGEALPLTAQSRLAGIAEVEVQPGSGLVGATLSGADIRQRTGTLVVGVWPKGAPHPSPYLASHVLQPGDRLILLGAPLPVERARLLAEGMEVDSSVESRAEPG